jgi:peptidoglycan/LPS O-acetylase OafA/YrhL
MRPAPVEQPSNTPPDYLPTLDGWRAVAISLVLFCHLQLPGHALSNLAPYGARGVDLFFAISGLLITCRLFEDAKGSGSLRLGSFYIRRAFRILPAAFAYLIALCGIGFGLRLIPLNLGQVIAAAFFYRNYYTLPVAQSWYTGHYWSLSVEEHFYLLWPGLLAIVGMRRARWTAPALACLFALWRALDTHFGWIASFNPALGAFSERTDYRMDGLLWGCTAAFLWSDRRIREWLRAHSRSIWAIAAVAAIVLTLIVKPPGLETILAFLLPLPLLVTVANPGSWLGRLLESGAARWWGRLSYSVYIWQQLFLHPYGMSSLLGFAQRLPWNLMLTVICASASYYLVERPLRRVGRRIARRYTRRAYAMQAS